MKILQVSNKVPFPPIDGGCIGINNFTHELIAQNQQVKMLALNTEKHFVDVEKLPANYRKATNIEVVTIDTNVKIWNAFLNLFSDKSYNIERFYSTAFGNKIEEVLKQEKYDIVQLESIFVTPYIPVIRKNTDAKIFLRAHNIEYLIWERMAKEEKNMLKKFYLNFLAKRLKKYELSCLKDCDAIHAVTYNDAELLKKYSGEREVRHIPFGINIKNHTYQENNTNETTLFHLGAMDWMPNVEGIKWFLKNVWPQINKLHPQLKFHLAGRAMPEYFKQLNLPNVIVDGEVPDAIAYMKSKPVMIVPLFSGSGVRVKIIEGMALGKAIITTSIGAEGINFEDNKNILIANTSNEFINKIELYLRNPALINELGKNANILAEQQHDISLVTKNLIAYYNSLLASSQK